VEPWQPSLRLCTVLLLAVIAIVGIIRFRLRDMPLERDEGEYAYAGQLILQGIPPYRLAYNVKLPGTYAAYALIMGALGQTPAAIHVGLLLINAGTIVLMYFLACRLFGRTAGLVAAASYGAFSTSASVFGFAAHATNFVVFFAIAGMRVLLDALDRKRAWLFFASGTLLGIAFLMKQPGIFFAMFAGLYLLWQEWTQSVQLKDLLARFGLFVVGVVGPYGLTCLILWRAGVFGKFWYWTFSYAPHYGLSIGDGSHTLGFFLPRVVEPAVVLWLMAAVGFTAFWWSGKAHPYALFCLGFFAFSVLAVLPGFSFFPHYFILLLPAASLLVAVAVTSANSVLTGYNPSMLLGTIPVLLFLVALAISIFEQRELLFDLNPTAVVRATYFFAQPFSEAPKIAEYIRTHSDPTARIAIMGSEPEIYFYAQRHSATGYIYAYPLIEDKPYAESMQREMISEIETARPEFIVIVRGNSSWVAAGHVSSKAEESIFAWLKLYLQGRYEVVGVAETRDADYVEYRWGQDAASYQTRSPNVIWVLRRKT